MLRAIAIGVDGIDVELRIVLDADSFGFHADRASLRRDCRRYVALTLRGWIVLRFTWEDVMFDPDYVAGSVAWAVSLRRGDAPPRLRA